MKAISLFLVISSFSALATTVNDLRLDCTAQYKVISSENINLGPIGRGMPRRYSKETREVLGLSGQDCDKLATNYSLKLAPGQLIKGQYGTLEDARVGKIFEEKVSQNFTYALDGELPLYPLVHEETVNLIGVSGKLNFTHELTEAEKKKIFDQVLSILEYGNKIQRAEVNIKYYAFFDLMLNLSLKNKQEYLQNLLLVFKNASKYMTSLVTMTDLAKLGQKINQLIHITQQTKMETYKKHPFLFENQLVTWISDTSMAPIMTAAEMQEFLEYSYKTALELKNVPQVREAVVLLFQYKGAAQSIKGHTQNSRAMGPKYDVNEASLALINAILAI